MGVKNKAACTFFVSEKRLVEMWTIKHKKTSYFYFLGKKKSLLATLVYIKETITINFTN